MWNFLWFSDIALIVTVPALWLESGLLAGMMVVAVLVPELFWIASFFWRLLAGKRLGGLTDYMFDPAKPRYLRAISLFHVFLPPLLLWMVSRLGYDSRAWMAQSALAWVVLPLTYWLADPKVENVNWAFGWGSRPQTRMPPLAHLGLVMIAFPLVIYLPTHLLLRVLFG
ncbi:MAG: membrane-associated protein [Betaproteobacteria bacterium]|nr:membrane-associated protein [Betaproteobacteria bacterium]